MDNWLIEIIKIVLGAIVGVLITEAFPIIKSFFKRGSLSYRNWRIKNNKEEYARIKSYKDNHATLAVELVRKLARSVFLAFMLIFFSIIAVLFKIDGNPYTGTPFAIALGAGIISADFQQIHTLIDRVNNFEKYKKQTIYRLHQLGATLDEE